MTVVPLRAPLPEIVVANRSSVGVPSPLEIDGGAIEAMAASVARVHAHEVDRAGRFPYETLAALRQDRLMGAMVPVALGGLGWSMRRTAVACCKLARACSSSAMVYAMHQIQVACLIAHAGEQEAMLGVLETVARDQWLLASVTSETGVGGEVRRSQCAVEVSGGRVRFEKSAPSISYGRHADALLLTARRNAEAEGSDQVMVVAPRADYVLTPRGGWDALGMRGTDTESFGVAVDTDAANLMAVPYAVVASDTMLPVSHLLWCSLWIGIAADALDRTRAFLRKQGRDAGPGIARFAKAVERLSLAQARVNVALDGYALGIDSDSALPLIRTADVNALKSSVSETCLQVTQMALSICGFAGYRNDTPYSVGRHLRDLNSAVLMVHNDRVREGTGRLLLARMPDLGIG